MIIGKIECMCTFLLLYMLNNVVVLSNASEVS